MSSQPYLAFNGHTRIAEGDFDAVTKAVAEWTASNTANLLVFDGRSGEQIDLSSRRAVLSAVDQYPPVKDAGESKPVGRPKLGVTAREVTLLPRQWDWLSHQRGGASATLRRLVDDARRANVSKDKIREACEAIYRFLTAIAGDSPGYEESLRALFAGEADRFVTSSRLLPPDIRNQAWTMAPAAFAFKRHTLNDAVPFEKRCAVEQAMDAVFGEEEVSLVTRITGGASAAAIFKITVGDSDYVLRIEGPSDNFRNPVRHYACLQIAAAAGIAPRLLYADEKNGISVTDFIRTEPVGRAKTRKEFLGMVAGLVKRLHATPLFPRLVDYLDGVDGLIQGCKTTGILPLEEMEDYFESYKELTRVYRAAGSDLVSSHNDLNSGNLLFSGDRLWLVDWESAFAADRYVDVAAAANFLTNDNAEVEVLLEAYFGNTLNDLHRARFFLMQQINRTFYAMVMLNYVAAVQPGRKLALTALRESSWTESRSELKDISNDDTKARLACALLNEVMQTFGSSRYSDALEKVKTHSCAAGLSNHAT